MLSNGWKVLDSREKLRSSWREPEDALYFSKIVESLQSLYDRDTAPEDSTEMQVVLKSLQWHDWLVGEEWEVDRYKKRDLLFAKFDESRLISNSSERFAKGGDFHVNCGLMSQPNWQKVGEEYDGIHVDPLYYR